MKLLYLSGPMTGVADYNRHAFEVAAEALRAQGYDVLNPHELDEMSPETSWEGYLRRDLPHVLNADAVVVLPGWRQSRGATLEVWLAHLLRIPVHAFVADGSVSPGPLPLESSWTEALNTRSVALVDRSFPKVLA